MKLNCKMNKRCKTIKKKNRKETNSQKRKGPYNKNESLQ